MILNKDHVNFILGKTAQLKQKICQEFFSFIYEFWFAFHERSFGIFCNTYVFKSMKMVSMVMWVSLKEGTKIKLYILNIFFLLNYIFLTYVVSLIKLCSSSTCASCLPHFVSAIATTVPIRSKWPPISCSTLLSKMKGKTIFLTLETKSGHITSHQI